MEKSFNGIHYAQPKDYCLVRERDQKRHFPIEKTDLVTDIAGEFKRPTVITLSTGSDFIDPWNSYLTFDVQGVAAGVQNMNLSGGYISLIDTIVLTDKFGKEIDRCDKLNRLNTTLLRGMFGDRYMDSFINVLDTNVSGWDIKNFTTGDAISLNPPRNVFISMNMLSGLFRISKLLPPHLTDGLQFWIYWTNSYEAFTQIFSDTEAIVFTPPGVATSNIPDNNPVTSHTISNITLVTDCFSLEPNLMALIEQDYVDHGLPIKFYSWGFDSSKEYTNLTKKFKQALTVEKSYTQATKIAVHSRNVIRIDPDVLQTGILEYDNYVREYPNMMYDEVNDQKYLANTEDYLHKNGRSFPRHPTKTLDQIAYYWKQAYGKNKYYIDGFSSSLLNDWRNGSKAPSWIKSVSRQSNVSPNISIGLPAESDHRISGVRIDGTNAYTFFADFPAAVAGDITQTTNKSVTISQRLDVGSPAFFKRRSDLWVEHSRYILVKPGGNVVFI